MIDVTRVDDDKRFEIAVARVLQIGVMLSAAVVGAGGIVYLARHGFESPSYHEFHNEPARLRSLGGIARLAATFSGAGLIQLGLVMLIATPIARVLISVVAFAREGDRLYVALTIAVLLLLGYSLLAGQ